MSTSIAAALAISLLSLGGVTAPTLLVAVVVVGVLVLLESRRTAHRSSAPSEGAARAALWLHVGACAGQLVPLPPAMLRRLSPHAFELWAASDREFGRVFTWHPISVDPPQTAFALATGLTVAVFFEIVRRASVSGEGRRSIAASVSGAVVVFCLIGLLHAAFGVERLYGLYTPVQPVGNLETRIVPSLLNPNHAAAVACVAPPLLIGLHSEAKLGGDRLLFALGATITGVFALLTLSRSGIAVFILEAVVMVAFGLWYGRRRGGRSASGAVGGTLVAIGAGAGALYLAMPLLVREVGNIDHSKFLVARIAWGIAREYSFTGIGRGAFASVSPTYQSPLPGQFRYTHVENWPAQLAVELGFPLAVALITLIGLAVARHAGHCLNKPTTFGALVALIGLAIHDLADFSCEYVGTGMVAVALLAIVTSTRGNAPRRATSQTPPVRVSVFSRMWATPAARAAAIAMALIAALWARGRTLEDDVDALAKASATRGLDGLEARIAEAAGRHPSEPYFPLVRGVQLLRTAAAGPHLVRAQALGPAWALNHFWLARWFAMHGFRAQGWSEFRATSRLDPTMTEKVIAAMIELKAPIDEIISVAPQPDALERLSNELSRAGRAADAESLDDRILLWHPNAVGARVRVIGRTVAAGKLEDARADARKLFASSPDDPRAIVTLAGLETDAETSEKILQDGLVRVPGDVSILQELVTRRGRRLGVDSVSQELGLLTQALTAKGGPPETPHVIVAEIELARKRPAAAVSAYLLAASLAADPRACLERAANLAESAGQLGVADATWQRLAELYPSEPRYSDARARVRRAILSTSLGVPAGP